MTGSRTRVSCCLLLIILSAVSADNHGNNEPDAFHECDRVCIDGEAPKTCEYDFFLEWYLSMSTKACGNCPFVVEDCYRPQCVAADGQRRALITVNRKLPGTPIMVCAGDRVVVHVHNHLDDGEGTTIHWHGIHQRGTPFMDGTHLVTQCPIPHKSSFMYDFKADVAGTYFYHSHTALQRGDGLHGSFVIHSTPATDTNWGLYDHDCLSPSKECEHIVQISDFLNEPTIGRHNVFYFIGSDYTLPTDLLINGRNMYTEYTDPDNPSITAKTPLEVFEVEQGKRYRFRVINAVGLNCPTKVAVDGHIMKVIASDGRNTAPMDVDTFIISNGERYDFVLNADQPVGNYWVKVWGMIDCEKSTASGYAVLRYKGAPIANPTTDPKVDRGGRLLNPLLYRTHSFLPSHGEALDIQAYELNTSPSQDLTNQKVDTIYFLGTDYHMNDNTRFERPFSGNKELIHMQKGNRMVVFNNITFGLQAVPPLTQPDDFDESLVCNKDTINITKCLQEKCICTHIIKFSIGEVVEMVIVDEGKFSATGHPIHIHGMHFYLLGSGRYGDSVATSKIYEDYYAGKLPRKLVNPPLKDTLSLQDGGYAIIRFVADNPGLWNMHCHRESHNQRGQALLIQIGERNQFAKIPEGFPQCGSWKPGMKQKQKEPESKPCSSDTSPILISIQIPTCIILTFVILIIATF